jgi:type VI secretion system secreted protein VgrG
MPQAGYTQENRNIWIQAPVLSPPLLVRSLRGRESISSLFSFELELLSEDPAIVGADRMGQPMCVGLERLDAEPRYFHGIVSRFRAGESTVEDLRAYRAEIVPKLWLLQMTADCRIFQNKSVPEIVEMVLNENGVSDFRFDLRGTYAAREYCVQYRETDLAFVSRLLEDEGIYYFFEHSSDRHVLVLADHKGYVNCLDAQVDYRVGSHTIDYVNSFQREFHFRPGKWSYTDYDFEKPSTYLGVTTNTVLPPSSFKNFEIYDYPGNYTVPGTGNSLVKRRLEAEEAGYEVVVGTSGCAGFFAGGKFELADRTERESGTYVITSIDHHTAEGEISLSIAPPGGNLAVGYSNEFRCIPADVLYRPPRLTPKTRVEGPQTAVVVGTAGEEIYTDKYGRIKVQFHWDREGKFDDKSSCWIRVAQNWAGQNWGVAFHPRIGQEVIVDFLEGDPDRPIITGRVYNAEQMPPYDLPDKQSVSTIKSRSTKQGEAENFNELRFDDTKGKEEIYFHAEKDFNRVVENNDSLKVGYDKKDKGNQIIEIFNNQTLSVGCKDASEGSQSITIFNNQSLTVGCKDAKDGSQIVHVYKDRSTKIETGNDKLHINKGHRDVILDKGNATTLLKEGNYALVVKQGTYALTVNAGTISVKAEADAISVESPKKIELKVGGSTITLEPSGITIKSPKVTMQGDGQVEVKAPMTQVSGDATLVLMGGVVNIN